MAEMQFAMRGVGSADDLIDQTTADPSGAATVDLSLDQLNYMSDLISEMRDMSRKVNTPGRRCPAFSLADRRPRSSGHVQHPG